VRLRQMDAASRRHVFASASCGAGAARALRLWPQGAAGLFAGMVPTDGEESCEVRVEVEGGPVAHGGIAVTNGATDSVAAVMGKLELVAARTGGVVATAGDEGEVTAALASTAEQPSVPAPFHPMRSPWWMSPFVACLGLEWWLRRRAGLR